MRPPRLLEQAIAADVVAGRLTGVRQQFSRQWFRSIAQWQAGAAEAGALGSAAQRAAQQRIAAQLERRLHLALERAWIEGYRLGHSIRRREAPTILPDEFLGEIERQKQFATNFARDIATGATKESGRMALAQRATLWIDSVGGAFNFGAVDAGEPGEVIFWRLGACNHCAFTGSSRVGTSRGWVPLSAIRRGDLVLTHRGRFRQVVAVHRRLARGRKDNRAVVLRGPAGSVGLTGDHKVLTPDGWMAAADVASRSLMCVELPHVEVMREVFGEAPREGPYDAVHEVPLRMRMRAAQVQALGGVHGVQRCCEKCAQLQAVGRPSIPGEDARDDQRERAEHAEGRGVPYAGVVQVAQTGWSLLHYHQGLLVRPGQVSDHLPLQVAVGAGVRSDPRRHGLAPQESRPRRRPTRELGALARLGTQEPACWAAADRDRVLHLWRSLCRSPARDEDWQPFLREGVQGPVDEPAPSPAQGDPDLLGLWDAVRGPAEPGSRAEDLLAIVCGGAPAETIGALRDDAVLYDITVADDHSFVIEGIVVSNCPDCPVLAENSPYSRDGEGDRPALPTTPRAGATQCRSRCCCHLEFGRDPTAVPRPIEDRPPFVDAAIKPPTAPAGLRVPTDKERRQLRDLETRVNFSRRRIADTRGTPEQARWITARRDAARRRREFMESRGIWDTPRLDVGEVISGTTVRGEDIRQITRQRGIDGQTARRLRVDKLRSVVGDQAAELQGLINDLPPIAGPDIPDLEQMFIRAGAPPELFGEALQEAEQATVPAVADTTVNSMGMGGRATIKAHLAALEVLAAGTYAIEIGPYDEGWEELVLAIGTWITGPHEDVAAFTAVWSRKVRGGVALARWQARA